MQNIKTITILNLGGGHGSAPLVGMHLDGELHYDYAIWSDTQDEPEWVYRQIDWLDEQTKARGGSPIVRVTAGNLMQNLVDGVNADGGRFVSIPAFTKIEGEIVMTRRQCTKDYKIIPVEQYIRRELLGLEVGQRIPKGVSVVQLFGFSIDEAGRAARLKARTTKKWSFGFPLFTEDRLMRKSECRAYMASWCRDFEWKWSACRSCPYLSNKQRLELSQADFEASCKTDDSLRVAENVCTRKMDNPMFVHRTCVPLRIIDLTRGEGDLFDSICESGCMT